MNSFSKQHNSIQYAYEACETTDKAAVSVDGTTMLLEFRLSMSKEMKSLPFEVLQGYREIYIFGIKCIIIDEISILSSAALQKTNEQRQQNTGLYEKQLAVWTFICLAT